MQFCTEKTIRNYRDILTMFLNFAGDVEISEDVLHVVKAYNIHLLDRKISSASVATYLRHLKAFFNYLEEDSILREGSVARRIKLPKTPKKNLALLTPADINFIFHSVKEESEWLIARNKLIIALMLDSGLRQAEVCKIINKDINYERHIMLIHGKGNKDRYVPLGLITTDMIERYRSLCPYIKPYLICDRRGNRITENAIKKFMSKLRKSTGISDLSSHKLRHNFATNWCLDRLKQYGHADPYQLMILMGHDDLKTTDKYIHGAYQIYSALNSQSHLDSIIP